MYQTDLWQDITTSVQRALDIRLDLLNESSLVHRSDALLARLPGIIDDATVTTATLMRRYQAELQKEWCYEYQLRVFAATLEDDLRELTRDVLVTIGISEGISV